MLTKMRWVCLVVLMLGFMGDAGAAVLRWNGSADIFWATPDNWQDSTLPAAGDTAMINVLPGPTVGSDGAVASQMWLGEGGSAGGLIVDGGTLTVNSWLFAQIGPQGDVIVNMISGNLDINVGGIGVGMRGPATLNMIGGTITCPGLVIGLESGSTGKVNVEGGTIDCAYLTIGRDSGSAGSMDVQGGTLLINGDAAEAVHGYIDSGLITAYDGNGTLELDYDITHKGRTTLRAVHNLIPSPRDGGLVSPGDVELSWILPDPCVPGEVVDVDVWFTDDMDKILNADPAAQIVSQKNLTSVLVPADPKTRYYWAVDTYIGDPNDPIYSPIFSFFSDNRAPEVAAGPDVVSWLQDGVRVRDLNGAVNDDGAIEPYTVEWTVVSEPDDPNSPDAVIDDPAAEVTSVTLSAMGTYVFQLAAFDGEYTGLDTVTINVYSDTCEAARSLADYEPLVGDLNGDCKVDDIDMMLLQENWLQDNSLTEEIELD